jgi:hypothetical protein
MPNLKDRVVKAIRSTPSKIENRYNYVKARNLKEEQERYEKAHDPAIEEARAKGYRTAELKYAVRSGKEEYFKEKREKAQGGTVGKLRSNFSNGMIAFSGGSANALKSDMYGVGKLDFGGMDILTMGGAAGGNTLAHIEDLTGFGGPRAQPKKLSPNMQSGRGNIVINVGGGRPSKRRRPTSPAPKEKDWQDNLHDLTGY